MKRALAALVIGVLGTLGATSASASPRHLSLRSAASYGVLAGTSVAGQGPWVVGGDLGVFPGTSVTGFPPSVVNGATHVGDATAAQAQTDLRAAIRAADHTPCDVTLPAGYSLSGKTLTPGVYCFTTSVNVTGTLTLDHQGDPNAFFLFKEPAELTTARAASVVVTNAGGESCAPNTTWVVAGDGVLLGEDATFTGDVLADQNVAVDDAAHITGRVMSRHGTVFLGGNVDGGCPTPPPSADLSVAATGTPQAVAPGQAISYTITATNDGPDRAAHGLMTASLPADLHFASLTAPAGWTCDVPDVDTSGVVSCTAPHMSTGTAEFALTATADPAIAGDETVSLPVAVSSTTADPDNDDLTASVDTQIDVPTPAAPVDPPAETPADPPAAPAPPAAAPVVAASDPAPTSCRGTRQFTLHLSSLGRAARGTQVVKANLVSAKGFRLRKMLVKLTQVKVDLRGLSQGRVTLRVTVRRHSGKTAVLSRTYTTCTLPKR